MSLDNFSSSFVNNSFTRAKYLCIHFLRNGHSRPWTFPLPFLDTVDIPLPTMCYNVSI